MKIRKRLIALTLAGILSLGLIGCAGAEDRATDSHRSYTSATTTNSVAADGGNYKLGADKYSMVAYEGVAYDQSQNQNEIQWNTEEYKYIDENGWKVVSVSPFSTFAADVDTASYIRFLVLALSEF